MQLSHLHSFLTISPKIKMINKHNIVLEYSTLKIKKQNKKTTSTGTPYEIHPVQI